MREPIAQDGYEFDAFASYARDPDEDLVAETKRFLERLHELRVPGVSYLSPLRIWVDKVSLVIRGARGKDRREVRSLTPDLRQVLDDELARCRSLLLFCSKRATRSEWVAHEIEWWLANRPGPIWLVVTEGADPVGHPQDVFPPGIVAHGLHGFWYDFRGFRDRKLRRAYEQARVNLAADLYGLEKERDRVAIAVKLAARRRRLIQAGIGAATAAALTAVAVGAYREWRLSSAIQTASAARLELARDGDAARGVETALAAQDTGWFARPPEVVETLRAALLASRLRARITAPVPPEQPALAAFAERSPDAAARDAAPVLAIAAGTSAWLIDAGALAPIGAPVSLPGDVIGIDLAAGGERVAAASQDEIRVWRRDGDVLTPVEPALRAPGVELTSVALRPDGAVVAAGTLLGAIELWRSGTDATAPFFEAPHTPPGEEAAGTPVFSVAFSHAGDLLASTGDDGAVRLRRERDGRWIALDPIAHGPVDTKVYRARFSRDDRLLVSSGSDGAARLWRLDGDRAQPAATFTHPTDVCDAQIAGRGELVAAMTVDGTLYLWQTRHPERPLLRVRTAAGRRRSSCALSFSPDGGRVVTSGEDRTARVWDAEPLVAPEVADLVGPVRALAVAPSGARSDVVAGSAQGDVVLWRADSGAALPLAGRGLGASAAPSAGGDAVTAASLTPDETAAATGGGDGQVQVWDLSSAAPRATLPSMLDVVTGVALDAAGERVAAITPHALRVTTLAGDHPRPRQMALEGGLAVAYEPSGGALVAVARDKLIHWSRAQERENTAPTDLVEPRLVGAQLSGDLRALVTVGEAGTQAWRTADGQRVGGQLRAAGAADPAAVSGDAGQVALGGAAGISVYATEDGREVVDLHPVAEPRALAFDPGGALLAAGEADGRVEVWQPPATRPVVTLLAPDPAEVTALHFTPDGRHLVSGDRKGRLRVYRLAAYAPEAWLRDGPALAAERHVRDLDLAAPTLPGTGGS